MVLKACRDYNIDGAILHSNKSCAAHHAGTDGHQAGAARRSWACPSVVIDADHMDARNFSIAQFETRVDAFMEMLLEKKGLR